MNGTSNKARASDFVAVHATAADLAAVTDVLVDAFAADPVQQWLFAECDRLVDPLVRVDADPDHRLPPSGSEGRGRRRRATRLTWVSGPAPIKSDRRRRHCRTDD